MSAVLIHVLVRFSMHLVHEIERLCDCSAGRRVRPRRRSLQSEHTHRYPSRRLSRTSSRRDVASLLLRDDRDHDRVAATANALASVGIATLSGVLTMTLVRLVARFDALAGHIDRAFTRVMKDRIFNASTNWIERPLRTMCENTPGSRSSARPIASSATSSPAPSSDFPEASSTPPSSRTESSPRRPRDRGACSAGISDFDQHARDVEGIGRDVRSPRRRPRSQHAQSPRRSRDRASSERGRAQARAYRGQDVARFAPRHPGGSVIFEFIGKDVTSIFTAMHDGPRSSRRSNRSTRAIPRSARRRLNRRRRRARVERSRGARLSALVKRFERDGWFDADLDFLVKKSALCAGLLRRVASLVVVSLLLRPLRYALPSVARTLLDAGCVPDARSDAQSALSKSQTRSGVGMVLKQRLLGSVERVVERRALDITSSPTRSSRVSAAVIRSSTSPSSISTRCSVSFSRNASAFSARSSCFSSKCSTFSSSRFSSSSDASTRLRELRHADGRARVVRRASALDVGRRPLYGGCDSTCRPSSCGTRPR